jgi:hypothetical protein
MHILHQTDRVGNFPHCIFNVYFHIKLLKLILICSIRLALIACTKCIERPTNAFVGVSKDFMHLIKARDMKHMKLINAQRTKYQTDKTYYVIRVTTNGTGKSVGMLLHVTC